MKSIRRRQSVGVSPIIATIILLGLTVGGGFLVWGVFTNYVRVSSTNAQVTVASAQLTVISAGSASGPGIFNFTITNSGSVVTAEAPYLTVTLYDGSNPIGVPLDDLRPLNPGATVSVCLASSDLDLPSPCYAIDSTGFKIQNTYDYTVKASFSGGSTYITSGTVLAAGS